MHVDDFAYDLPPERIADRPAEPRDAARMLVYSRTDGAVAHRAVRDLPEYLRAGDLLVVNDTRVMPWRLCGARPGGGHVEVLVLQLDGDRGCGLVRPAARLRPGVPVVLEGGALELVPQRRGAEGSWEFTLCTRDGTAVAEVLERVGRAPLPPYVPRPRGGGDPAQVASDRERYQTVYASRPGAVAAPTAGLHFTPALLDRLERAGVGRAAVTLHVGPGTFAPVRVPDVRDHAMHSERFELSADTAAAVARARAGGGRVVAVGTTVVRALETRATPDRGVRPGAGETDIFLHPERPPTVVDGLLTNFHLPRSTLLMLVAALVGRERLLALYREAVAEGYRFYSFGDAMLVL